MGVLRELRRPDDAGAGEIELGQDRLNAFDELAMRCAHNYPRSHS
jgi:hypothetical protein